MPIKKLTFFLPQAWKTNLRRLVFAGHGPRCFVCGTRVKAFKQSGHNFEVLQRRDVIGGRPKAADRCPVCHAQDRTRLVQFYLQRQTSLLREPASVLHFAPELALADTLASQPWLDYVAFDMDATRYRYLEQLVTGDITELPFEADRFDWIICCHVLEHVPDDRKAMAELLRVLKPGGHAILQVPIAADGQPTHEQPQINDPAEQERLFGQWDHVRLYGLDYPQRVAEVGFEPRPYHAFQDAQPQAEQLGLNPRETLYVFRKPG